MDIDHFIFNSSSRRPTLASKPMLVCVSAVEPGLRLADFCMMPTFGTKIVVGDGSHLQEARGRYQDVHFVGRKSDASLAHYLANADVLVCPNGSQGVPGTIERAVCCGTPIAARSHVMTDDLIISNITGMVADDLEDAIVSCLCLDRMLIEQIGHRLFARVKQFD